MQQIPTPAYVVYEDRLRRNLELIESVKRAADIDIIMAFKANASQILNKEDLSFYLQTTSCRHLLFYSSGHLECKQP